MTTGKDRNRWLRCAKALFLKDVRAELRTKVAVNAVGIFAFTSMLLITLVTAVLKTTHNFSERRFWETYAQSGRDIDRSIASALSLAWEPGGKLGLLWILLIFAAFAGLSHSFVHEEETGTTTALKLSLPAESVYAGKLFFNLALIFLVALMMTPVYMLITGMPAGNPFAFLFVMTGGCTGLGATATIIAALTAKAQRTGALYGALGLPMMFAFVILLINGSNALYHPEAGFLQSFRDIGGIFAYSIALITLSALVFRMIWEE